MKSFAIFLCLATAALLIAARFPFPCFSIGSLDFIQYWVSFDLMFNGQNPYDMQTVQTAQNLMTGSPQTLMMTWTPPWTHVLLAPVLVLPFEHSITLWIVVQILLLCLIASLAPQALGELPPNIVLNCMGTALFFPALSCLTWGQVGVLLATSVILFLYFERRRSLILAGLALIPLTIKPHLFLLLIPPGIKWVVQLSKNERRAFLVGALGGLSLLIGASVIISPLSVFWWINTFFLPPKTTLTGVHFAHYQEWPTATLSTSIRMALSSWLGTAPNWPLVVVPLVGFCASAIYFFKDQKPVVWRKVAPPLLCLSLVLSPYGWSHDQSVLIVCQFVLICRALQFSNRSLRIGLIGAALFLQIVPIATSNVPSHHYVWLPIAILGLLYIEKYLSRLDAASCSHIRNVQPQSPAN